MVKETRWSVRADRERIEILDYWFNRNGSAVYSTKLSGLITVAIKKIAEFPESGHPTDKPCVRFKIIRDYKIYYQIQDNHLEILTIWDSRRNPLKFKL